MLLGWLSAGCSKAMICSKKEMKGKVWTQVWRCSRQNRISYHHLWEGFRGQVWKPASPNSQAIHRCLSVWSDGNSLVFAVMSDRAKHYTLKNWRIWENVTCSQTIIYNMNLNLPWQRWVSKAAIGWSRWSLRSCVPAALLLGTDTTNREQSHLQSVTTLENITSKTQTWSLCSVLLLKTTFLLFKPPVIQYQPRPVGLFFSGQDTPQTSYFLLPSFHFHQCENKPLKAFWGGVC